MPNPAPKPDWTRHLRWVFLAIAAFAVLRSEVYFGPKHVDWTDVPLQRLDGAPLPPGSLRGKAVLLNFWAPWCGPCREEMPSLQQLQDARPQLAVVGIETDADQYAEGLTLARQAGLSFLLVRPSATLGRIFGHPTTIPTTLYISPSGKVVHTVTGVVPKSVMERYAADASAGD
jgi:thiol-disulfide isomerase/thioredoxin